MPSAQTPVYLQPQPMPTGMCEADYIEYLQEKLADRVAEIVRLQTERDELAYQAHRARIHSDFTVGTIGRALENARRRAIDDGFLQYQTSQYYQGLIYGLGQGCGTDSATQAAHLAVREVIAMESPAHVATLKVTQ